MVSDYLKNTKKYLPRLLLGASLLVGITTAAKVYAYIIESANIPQMIEYTISKQQQSEETTKKYQSKYSGAAAGLNKKNVFMPPAGVKINPVKQISAILGNEVLITDKWYKAGDKIGDAEVIEVSSMAVRIKWNDTETTFYPFESPGAESLKSISTKTVVVSEEEPDMPPGRPVGMQMRQERPVLSQEQREQRRQMMLKRIKNRPQDRPNGGSGNNNAREGNRRPQGDRGERGARGTRR